MAIKTFTFNPFFTNCFLVHDQGEAAIVDPSCQSEDEINAVIDFIRTNSLSVRHLLLTHAHIDHIFGCTALSEEFGMAVKVHADDADLLRQAERQAELFGIPLEPISAPIEYLTEGERIVTGTLEWVVLHTPGHSPGSVSFADHENRYVIAGDALFQGSIGRTDLWQGSLPILMESIFQKIVPLGSDFTVYPGHGPKTTVGAEMQSNPFLTGSDGFG